MYDRYSRGITVVPYRPVWEHQALAVERALTSILRGVEIETIEHVGSTSVPGLAAKPILDIDIIARRDVMASATAALERAGYRHCGDLGLTDREAFTAPDDQPSRNVYLCVAGTLHVRNHLAVRETLRKYPALRDRYGAVKLQLASQADMNINRYLAGKSSVLQEILALSDLTDQEKLAILKLNAPD